MGQRVNYAMSGVVDHNESLKKSFYAGDLNYKEFTELTKERYEYIKMLVDKFNLLKVDVKESAYDRYLSSISYIQYTSKNVSRVLFDEKVLFVVLANDPELRTYHTFMEVPIISKFQIETTTDYFKKKRLIEKRKDMVENYKTSVREQIGFYEEKLFKFEKTMVKEKIFTKFLDKNIYSDYTSCLVDDIKFDINDINDYSCNFDKINTLVNEYRLNNVKYTYKDVMYHVYVQNNLLGLDNNIEKLIFIILMFDPELNALDIFENSCNWKEIYEALKDTIDGDIKSFIKLEKIYNSLDSYKKTLK